MNKQQINAQPQAQPSISLKKVHEDHVMFAMLKDYSATVEQLATELQQTREAIDQLVKANQQLAKDNEELRKVMASPAEKEA